MNLGRTVFSQLVDFLPTYQFQICVDRYQGNRYVKEFSCWDQFLCLAFAQLTYRESLRDIEACLSCPATQALSYGLSRGQVSRNTLAHANEHSRLGITPIFPAFLIARGARDLYRHEPFREWSCPRRCMPWTPRPSICACRFSRGEISPPQERGQMHTLLDLRGSIPTNVYVTGGASSRREHFGPVASRSRSVLLARSRLCGLRSPVCLGPSLCLLLTRAKKNMQFYRRDSRRSRTSGRITQRSDHSAHRTPMPPNAIPSLRRIHDFNAKKDSRLTFLSNNFLLPALTIAQCTAPDGTWNCFFAGSSSTYHQRFLRHLGKRGETQVWVAVTVYVLVAIVKKQLGLDLSLYKILQILSVTVFEKTPILEGFSNFSDDFTHAETCIQLNLFDF